MPAIKFIFKFIQFPEKSLIYLLFCMIQDPTKDCSQLLKLQCLFSFLKSRTSSPILTFFFPIKTQTLFLKSRPVALHQVLQPGLVCFLMIRFRLNRVERILYTDAVNSHCRRHIFYNKALPFTSRIVFEGANTTAANFGASAILILPEDTKKIK